jgi:hypothetical protein
MKHIKQVSSSADGGGQTTPLEQLILLLLSVYFSGWQNFSAVIGNLEKFYSKT